MFLWKSSSDFKTPENHLLLTMSFYDINDVEGGRINVEDFEHLLINPSHQSLVSIQEAADGSHSNRPVQLSAAYKHAATCKNFFLLEAHSDETLVLEGLLEISKRQIFYFTAQPQNPRNFFHTLQTFDCMK